MSTTDLIGLAIDKNPTQFSEVFGQLMTIKTKEAISALKVDIAKSIYGDGSEEAEETVTEDVVEEEAEQIDENTPRTIKKFK